MNEYQINEALSPENAGEKRDFRIKIRSDAVSLEVPSRTEGEHWTPPETRMREKSRAVSESAEQIALASVCEEDGRIVVTYDDSVTDPDSLTRSRISFAKDQPEVVTVERMGMIRSYMIFEQRRRHRAIYKMPFGSFEMTVCAIRVENSLGADGGALRLEYLVECGGAAEEKVSLDIEIDRIAPKSRSAGET